jgi:hypothetical protein
MEERGSQRRRRRRRSRAPASIEPSPFVSAVVSGDPVLHERKEGAPPGARKTAPASPPPVRKAPRRPPPPPPASARDTRQRGEPAGARKDVPGAEDWERTHLEQTMFALAQEHSAAAAARVRKAPPDPQGEQTHSLLAILMSFLALEAFINMVGSDRLGPRYRYYDRMPPEGKWTEVTRLVSKTGKTFDEDGPEITGLSTLRTWRNMLTHYKGEYEGVQRRGQSGETRIEALLSSENAARAVEIARTLYRSFYEFDRRSPPRQFMWLDDRPHHVRAHTAQTSPAPALPPPTPPPGRPTPAPGDRQAQAGARRPHPRRARQPRP